MGNRDDAGGMTPDEVAETAARYEAAAAEQRGRGLTRSADAIIQEALDATERESPVRRTRIVLSLDSPIADLIGQLNALIPGGLTRAELVRAIGARGACAVGPGGRGTTLGVLADAIAPFRDLELSFWLDVEHASRVAAGVRLRRGRPCNRPSRPRRKRAETLRSDLPELPPPPPPRRTRTRTSDETPCSDLPKAPTRGRRP